MAIAANAHSYLDQQSGVMQGILEWSQLWDGTDTSLAESSFTITEQTGHSLPAGACQQQHTPQTDQCHGSWC